MLAWCLVLCKYLICQFNEYIMSESKNAGLKNEGSNKINNHIMMPV